MLRLFNNIPQVIYCAQYFSVNLVRTNEINLTSNSGNGLTQDSPAQGGQIF